MLVCHFPFLVVHPCSPTHSEGQREDSRPPKDVVFADVHGVRGPAINLKTAYTQQQVATKGAVIMDIETRLQQVATVINQIDDPKVPRNIRRQAKEACENWLLNKAKKLDVRIAIQRVLRRNRITDDQLDLISEVADALQNHQNLAAEVTSTLHEGKLSKETKPLLQRMLVAIEEEE